MRRRGGSSPLEAPARSPSLPQALARLTTRTLCSFYDTLLRASYFVICVGLEHSDGHDRGDVLKLVASQLVNIPPELLKLLAYSGSSIAAPVPLRSHNENTFLLEPFQRRPRRLRNRHLVTPPFRPPSARFFSIRLASFSSLPILSPNGIPLNPRSVRPRPRSRNAADLLPSLRVPILPPELMAHIIALTISSPPSPFDNLSTTAFRTRSATLRRLSLVNSEFRETAQGLLESEVFIIHRSTVELLNRTLEGRRQGRVTTLALGGKFSTFSSEDAAKLLLSRDWNGVRRLELSGVDIDLASLSRLPRTFFPIHPNAN